MDNSTTPRAQELRLTPSELGDRSIFVRVVGENTEISEKKMKSAKIPVPTNIWENMKNNSIFDDFKMIFAYDGGGMVEILDEKMLSNVESKTSRKTTFN